MGLARTVLQLESRRRLRQLYRRAADPGPVQERVLFGLLRRARHTEWGRRHRFADIRSVADFQQRVPLVRFPEVRRLWERIEAGERDLAWPGRTRYFALSAGTTSGSKHVPVTGDAIRSNRRAGRDVLALCLAQAPPGEGTFGQALYLGGSTRLRASSVPPAAGAPPALVGDASGIMNAHIPFFARRYHLPKPEVAALDDWEEKIDAICRRYLDNPVWMVSALPSWVVPLFERLIETGRARRGGSVRTVTDVWPKFRVLVSFGMALEPYLPTIEALVGRPLCYVNTYSSSEAGMTAVQDRQVRGRGGARGLPGMLVLPDNGVFYEFVRLEEADSPEARRWTLAEVERDVPYEVVVSTNGGIWAYRLGDVVRFETLRPHRVVMAGRTQHVLSAFGEHLIGEELERAVMAACEAAGAEAGDFAVEPLYPRAGEGDAPRLARARHRWHVEFRRPPANPDLFLQVLDGRLKELNEDYASYRKGDRAVAEPELVALAPGTFYEWMKRRGRLGGQYKVPRVLADPDEAEGLRKVARELAGGKASAGPYSPSPP